VGAVRNRSTMYERLGLREPDLEAVAVIMEALNSDVTAADAHRGIWTYAHGSSGGLIELGNVRGRDVALPVHFHDEDQVSFVVAGRRRFLIDAVEHEVGPGQGICIPYGTPHQSLPESDNILCLNFYLTPGCYDVRSLIADLRGRWRCGRSLDTPSVSGLIATHRRRRARSANGQSLALPVASVRAAAHEAGMTREGYSRRFRRLHGVAPDTFRLLSQLNLARGLLRQGAPIASVAAEAGFSDQSHLGRCFRRTFGVTPGRYRIGADHIRS
jgi:AraC-like DNA-binding protein/mannose-6-phosphate isomerase-like protein (cupin superfamily)